MSDSDDDSLQNNVFTFQNDNTTMCARGPNINNTNITGLSFRNNVLTSTMHMPVNFEQQRLGGSNFDQRSMYYRRETSPMSLRSVPDYRPPNFNHSMYQNGMGNKRSIFHERGRSPMSVRSMDSTASVSAADIVFAFKNIKFNKYDLRIIKEAYNKLIKTRQRKRIEKRRNLKLFLKGTRRKSGEDSGEQGSDSSLSSDDCRSVKTTICNENIPGLKQMTDVSHFSTIARHSTNRQMLTNSSHFNNNLKNNPIFTDCTENIKQNALRNMCNRSVSNLSTKESFNTTETQNHNQHHRKESIITQKERFKKGFLLPSQRFNKSVAGQTQENNNEKTKKSEKNKCNPTKFVRPNSGSDEEEFFYGFPVHQDAQTDKKKRSLDTEENCYSNKRNKVDLTKSIQISEDTKSMTSSNSNAKSNDFIFAKPNVPIKKGNLKKDIIPEKLLAKSRVPPIAEEIDFNFPQKNNSEVIEKQNLKENKDDTELDLLHFNSDISMRPSFIKRKLFTQKLDVAENKNASTDSINANSPQNIYSESMRERNKARKLVISQSCLSREVTGEDNNVLDLIHKIVPPDQINATSVANKSEYYNNRTNSVDNNDKWDVTEIIANCDNQDMSDTYTDEEIFSGNRGTKKENPKVTKSKVEVLQCKIVVEKLKPQLLNKPIKDNKFQKKLSKEISKKSVTDCVKSFWDTDFESDMEANVAPSCNYGNQQNQETVFQQRKTDTGENQGGINKKAIPKGKILTVRNCHKDSKLNNSLKFPNGTINNDIDSTEKKESQPAFDGKDKNEVIKTHKDTISIFQKGKKEDVKENVPIKNKLEERRSKAKTKQCADCMSTTDKPKNTPRKVNKTKVVTNNNSGKEFIKNGFHNGNSMNTLDPIYCKNSESKQVNKDSSCNIIKSSQKHNVKALKNSEKKQVNKDIPNKINNTNQKSNTKPVKELANNVITRPNRKSKEKSIIGSPQQKTTTKNSKATNKIYKTKSSKEKDLDIKNTSLNNISTIMTRSRGKLSFNSSSDYSSMNLSNISNRSLRLRQRIQRNIN